MKYALKINTAPAAEPITLTELKTHLRVVGTAEDTPLTSLITAARDAAEKFTGRAFINRTYDLYLDEWPSKSESEWWDGVREGASVREAARAINLPYPPLSSVSAINYYSDADVETLWAATNYHVDIASDPGRIALKQGGTIPLPTKTINGIKITYVAGYGAAASSVPQLIRNGVLMIGAHLYENRGDDPDQAVMKSGAASVLRQYKLLGIT